MTALRLGIATAATALMTASAFAADLYIPIEQPFIPDVSAPLGWSGAYVGAHVGYGWGEPVFDVPPGATVPDFDMSGWLAGVQAGYNVNLDGVVLGVEGDVAWSDISATITAAGDDFSGSATTSIDWLATLRGRVGFAADAFLIYGTAGIAFAGGDYTATVTGEDSIVDSFSDSNTHVGWVVGGGVETMLTETISLKAEYLYHEFGAEAYFDSIVEGGARGDLGFNVSTAKIGLNFHF